MSGPSLTWEFSDTERARARDILHRLEDFRVLHAPYEVEEDAAVFGSVGRLRTYLSEQVELCESAMLRDQVRAMRAAVRQFVTDIEAAKRLAHRISHTEQIEGNTRLVFSTMALGVLRGRVGVAIAEIGRVYNIPIDGDLAHVTPPDAEAAEGSAPLTPLYFDDGEGTHIDPRGPGDEFRPPPRPS
ncbi:hypothetical protein [Streptomyces sp. NBC_00649]|uniref:hypothetical protein n=1 Tax=Streptomyces sp. NBC_00649 TaxID=2975798 RepID=UPI0032532F2E